MKKLSKRVLMIFIAVAMVVFPAMTSLAVEEVPIAEAPAQETIEAPAQEVVTEEPVQEVKEAPQEVVIPSEQPVQIQPENQEELSQTEAGGVEDFVTRMYKVCLGRTPDPVGLNAWVDALKSGRATGAVVAHGFIFSKEFQDKNLPNKEYIEAMYAAFFGRPADPVGLAGWMDVLNTGYTRLFVLSGFVNSIEFTQLCASYGIIRGELVVSPSEARPDLASFVSRFYKLCLGRDADAAGLNEWVGKLMNKSITGSTLAYGFVFSPEFLKKRVTNPQFVDIMYSVFFDRNPDPQGKTAWIVKLDKGTHRLNVLAGFVNSQEFTQLCAKYKIDRGTMNTVPDKAHTPLHAPTLKGANHKINNTLTITAVPHAQGYEIYRTNVATGKMDLMSVTPKTTWTDHEITAGNTYIYMVEAYQFITNDQCIRTPSNAVTIHN